MKKFLSLALVLVLVLSLSTVAFAAESTTHHLKITNSDPGRVYELYQIFTADVSTTEEGGYKLSNVKYGANYGATGEYVPEEVLNQLKAADIDKWARTVVTTGDPIATEACTGDSVTFDGLTDGYYLVKEVTETIPDGETYSKFLVQIVGNTSIATKAGTTSSEKKVLDDEQEGYQDSADYDIGDWVPFQLKATVASDYAHYTNGYKLTFHDVMEDGLTFDPDSVIVYINGTEIHTGYTVYNNPEDGCTFAVHFSNLKNIATVGAGTEIVVHYKAQLNEKAVIGETGNWNKSKITYTNNPNTTQDGEPDEGGNTPWDSVVVFTYQVDVNKYANVVDPDNKLAGAEFTLTKKGHDTPIAVIKSEDGTSFSFKGLDAGTYVLTETVTPEGYNTIAPIEFTIHAEHTAESAHPVLIRFEITGEQAFQSNPNGTGSTDVINKAGSSLPTTGGEGTVMFYLIGTILAMGAGVMLITKKRVNNI